MTDETFSISVNGHSLRVKLIFPIEGISGDAPTLVLLHEGLGSIGQWKDFPEALAEATGLAAVVFDRYGFGGSGPLMIPRDGSYLQREDISSLVGVLEHCQIEYPVLIGHSDGGTIALLYAAAFPERPLGVIVEAAHVFVEDATRNGITAADKAFKDGGLAGRLARYHGDNTEAMFNRWVDDWLSSEFEKWNIKEILPSIHCPVLVIQGEDDEYGTLDQVDAICAGVSGVAERFIIPGCGHSPHIQARGAVLHKITDFIEL